MDQLQSSLVEAVPTSSSLNHTHAAITVAAAALKRGDRLMDRGSLYKVDAAAAAASSSTFSNLLIAC